MRQKRSHIVKRKDLRSSLNDFVIRILIFTSKRKHIFIVRLHLFADLYFSNKDEISRDRLADADVIVFGGPRDPFTAAEFAELKAWLNGGGRAMIMLGDGGEKHVDSNMNYLLEEYVLLLLLLILFDLNFFVNRFGMTINADSVIRSVYYKYLHPKEVFICEGVLVPDLIRKKVYSI